MPFSTQSFVYTSGPQTFDLTDFVPVLEKYLTVNRNGSPLASGWSLSGTTVTITSPTLTATDVILIERNTDLANADFLVEFTDASTLRAADLQSATQQLLHICQELYDGVGAGGTFMGKVSGGASWDAEGQRIQDGPAVAFDWNTAAQTDFVTKEYVDDTAFAAGNLPLATGYNIGDMLVIKDVASVNTWQVRQIWTETSTFQVTGPGSSLAISEWTAAGGTTGVSADTGYVDTSSFDNEMLILRDNNPNGGAWGSGSRQSLGSNNLNAADKAIEFDEVFYGRSQSLRNLGARGLTQLDSKTFRIFATSSGWRLRLNAAVFAHRNQANTYWSSDYNPAIRFCVWDVTNGKVLDGADDFVYNGSSTLAGTEGSHVETTGANASSGNIEYPRKRYMEVGNLTWDNSLSQYSRSVAFKNDETYAFEFTWNTHLPVSGGSMDFQILVQAPWYGASNLGDWSIMTRPSTLTIETAEPFNMVSL